MSQSCLFEILREFLDDYFCCVDRAPAAKTDQRIGTGRFRQAYRGPNVAFGGVLADLSKYSSEFTVSGTFNLIDERCLICDGTAGDNKWSF